MKRSISEILRLASSMKTKAEKIQFLQENDSVALRNILLAVFNPAVKFLLPETDPPYKPGHEFTAAEILHFEVKKLYMFVEGGNDKISKTRREQLFIQLLEAVHPEDAKLLLSVKNKKLPSKGINVDIVKAAFTNLLPVKEKVVHE